MVDARKPHRTIMPNHFEHLHFEKYPYPCMLFQVIRGLWQLFFFQLLKAGTHIYTIENIPIMIISPASTSGTPSVYIALIIYRATNGQTPCCCQDDTEAPNGWSHANLEPLQQFLREQAAAGAWCPRFSEGLWARALVIRRWSMGYNMILRGCKKQHTSHGNRTGVQLCVFIQRPKKKECACMHHVPALRSVHFLQNLKKIQNREFSWVFVSRVSFLSPSCL